MNIALVGYGRMNRAIEQQAQQRDHTIVAQINNNTERDATDWSQVDIAMEFSATEPAKENMQFLLEKGIATVAGTTGCQDVIPTINALATEKKIGFLWSPNFSIGVNIFWQLLAQATQLLNAYPEYDVSGHEWHHAQKQDSPSGTALKTADVILENSQHKDTIVTERLDRPPNANELHFSSTRAGFVPGTHLVSFDGQADTIDIKHTARSSAGFAYGAVLVGEWLRDKDRAYTMDEFLADTSPLGS